MRANTIDFSLLLQAFDGKVVFLVGKDLLVYILAYSKIASEFPDPWIILQLDEMGRHYREWKNEHFRVK